MNAGLSHMDVTFWNSRDGDHPVTSFWADRFLIDPTDPKSGPVKAHVQESPDWVGLKRMGNEKAGGMSDKPFFSMDGTEGSWASRDRPRVFDI